LRLHIDGLDLLHIRLHNPLTAYPQRLSLILFLIARTIPTCISLA